MEDAGASAVILPSMFQEQITAENRKLEKEISLGRELQIQILDSFPEMHRYNHGPDGYLELIRTARAAAGIPIIASINGYSPGRWIEYAEKIQQAGASAVELSLYAIPADANVGGAEMEEYCCQLVEGMKAVISIPLAVKIFPYFTSLSNMTRRLDQAGADAIVIFNRPYQPDLDPRKLEAIPRFVLSTSDDLLLRLTWASLLYGAVDCDIAITGGVHTGIDVVKAMMAGGRVAMTTSGLMKNGIDHVRALEREMRQWMEAEGYDSVEQMQGIMSRLSAGEPACLQRAHYMRVLDSNRSD
jgi:dihydroorotate dehydrogenase (fumarate)